MKIKTCFFVLTVGLCNLIKGGNIPSLNEVKDEIAKYEIFKPEKLITMCQVQSEDGEGLNAWQTSFTQVANNIKDIPYLIKAKLFKLLLTLGVLQINDELITHDQKKWIVDELTSEIEREMGMLKEYLRMFSEENLKEVNADFTIKELGNEYKKRCEQARDRVQIKEKESSSDGINHAKKRKRIEIKELTL